MLAVSGWRFYHSGFPAFARRPLNMASLVAVGTYDLLYSLYNTAGIGIHMANNAQVILALAAHKAMELYYESAAVLIPLLFLDKFVKLRFHTKTSVSIKGLLD